MFVTLLLVPIIYNLFHHGDTLPVLAQGDRDLRATDIDQ